MNYRYNFEDKKKKKRKKIIFIIIMFIVALMFTSLFLKNTSNVLVNKIASIITKPLNLVYDGGSSIFNGLGGYFGNTKKINAKADKLEEEKRTLEFKLLESQKILDENESLKEMLEIKKKFQHFNIKLGSIVYREHDNWTQTFRVDLGKNDGVELNQAVVHVNGLVGFVSKVLDNSCTVTTILDPSSSVSVNISTINEPAILQGDLSMKSNNRLKLTFIPIDAEISISDMLYTSGLGATYPGSIPVGKILEVVNSKNDMNRYAVVEPSANIRTISEVGIIID